MKKTATLLSLILLAGGFTAMAQPVITSTITYTVGDQLTSTNVNGQGLSGGNAGANQTWNFSSVQGTGPGLSEVIAVASSPYAASYPTANVCIKSGNVYAYSLYTATEGIFLGAYNGQANIVYSNPEKNFKMPFSYQEVLTDTWQASFTTQGVPVTRYGNTKATYDGYGTLITPAGTFNNAVRLKLEQDYYDVINADTVFYQNVGYSWIQNGTRSLMAMGELNLTVAGFTQTSYYASYSPASAAASVNEWNMAEPELSIYPNPSAGEVNIESEGLSFVNLMTIDGKLVKGFPVSSTQTQLSLNLPTGLYIADCIYKDGRRASRRLVIQ